MAWLLNRNRAKQRDVFASKGIEPYKNGGGLYVSNELQTAMKSMPYSQYVQDFIQGSGTLHELYSEVQLESAYKTSVYLFSAMRKVANLASDLKIVAEYKNKDGQWERASEAHHLNRMMNRLGSRFIFELCIYYMLYGKVLIYKRKSAKGAIDYARAKELNETPTVLYPKRQVAGLHIIPNAYWEALADDWTGDIYGFTLMTGTKDITGDDRTTLAREEVIFSHDFDPRNRNGAVSMASLAINNAITNAAIARWASHYFMSGAMPLLLISTEDGINQTEEASLAQYKNFVERAWAGLFGRFSLRAVFTSRKLNVQEAGISADKVNAPELDASALKNITATFQIAPDLIVPPDGGSDNARHQHLIIQAYTDSVLPLMHQILTDMNEDLGTNDDSGLRLVIDEKQIKALQAERAERSGTEISIFQAGVQTYGQTQESLDINIVPELDRFINTNEGLKSIERILREDAMVSDKLAGVLASAWEGGVILRSEYRDALGFTTPAWMRDGFKFEVIPTDGGGSVEPMADETDTPPTAPAPNTPTTVNGQSVVNETSIAKQNARDEKAEQAHADKPETDGNKIRQYEADLRDAVEVANESENKPNTQQDKQDNNSLGKPNTPKYLPPPVQSATVSVEITEPLCAMLSVANDQLIDYVQRQLAQRMGIIPVEWVAPHEWHMTMVYALDANDADITSARKLMPSAITPLKLRSFKLCTFEDEKTGKVAICLAIEPDNPILDVQSKIYSAFATYNVPLSPYSNPNNYKPHVTLGYAPIGSAIPVLAYQIIVEPTALHLCRDNYAIVKTIPVIQSMTQYMESLGKHYEPDGQNQVMQPFSAEAIAHQRSMVMRYRTYLRTHVHAWITNEEPLEDIPPALKRAVDEACKDHALSEVLSFALTAIDKGLFDPDGQVEENPVLIIVRGKRSMQKSAQDELRAWGKSLRKNRTKQFELFLIPLEIEQFVKGQLSEGKPVNDTIKLAEAMLTEWDGDANTRDEHIVNWGKDILEDEDADDELLALFEDEDTDDDTTD